MKLHKIRSAYVSTALIIFNLLVVFVVVNILVASGSMFKAAIRSVNPVSEKYPTAQLALVYPGKAPWEIAELLNETWSRPYVYEPYTQFKERPYRGRYVNVDEHGFRHSTAQAPWPPDPRRFNIFVFGGSTTFGYGVADTDTVASFLQDEIQTHFGLPAAVYNFGRGFYYSTQERILFQTLLTRGHRPQLAVFIDGLNEFYHRSDEPMLTRRLREYIASGPAADLRTAAGNLPAVHKLRRFFDRIACRLRDCDGGPLASREAEGPRIAEFLTRYQNNKRLIEAAATVFGIWPAFVWQPVPTYKYDQASHLFAKSGFGRHALSGSGYRAFALQLRDKAPDENFIWCADIQQARHEPLYVDLVHYTSTLAKSLAACITSRLRQRKFFDFGRQ
jgi:hypothetical protein